MRMMRILMLFCIICFVLGCKDTPKNQTMQDQLKVIFPTVQDIEFDTTHQEVVAQFFDGRNYTEAFFSTPTPTLLRTQHYLDYDMLPKIVRDSLEVRYPAATYSQNDEIKLFGKTLNIIEIFYIIELETATEFIHTEIQANGNIKTETREILSEEDQIRREEEGVEEE